MKKVLWFVFFIVVYGYADKPRFDNEGEDKPKYDNDDYEYTEDGNGIFEKVSEVFKKTRFGVRAGVGLGWSTFGEDGKAEKFFEFKTMEFGGAAIIPLTETGTFLLDVELNAYYHEGFENGLRIPLLFQYMPYDRIVLETGICLDIPIDHENDNDYDKYGYTRNDINFGFVFGVGYVIEKFIIGSRIIYDTGFWGELYEGSTTVFNFNVSYLF